MLYRFSTSTEALAPAMLSFEMKHLVATAPDQAYTVYTT